MHPDVAIRFMAGNVMSPPIAWFAALPTTANRQNKTDNAGYRANDVNEVQYHCFPSRRKWRQKYLGFERF
jgi:hypothetical protein